MQFSAATVRIDGVEIEGITDVSFSSPSAPRKEAAPLGPIVDEVVQEIERQRGPLGKKARRQIEREIKARARDHHIQEQVRRLNVEDPARVRRALEAAAQDLARDPKHRAALRFMKLATSALQEKG